MDFTLSLEEKKNLLKLARSSIASKLTNAEIPDIPTTRSLSEHCGVFVTLTKMDALRGCIGYITARKPLLATVADSARAAAFEDTRFSPLIEEELAEIIIEISVLSPPQRIKDIEKIQVGKHGIILRQGYYSGLLLPQVATEYGWDRETFLANTCYKAGLPANCWKDPDVIIETFSALIFNEDELGIQI